MKFDLREAASSALLIASLGVFAFPIPSNEPSEYLFEPVIFLIFVSIFLFSRSFGRGRERLVLTVCETAGFLVVALMSHQTVKMIVEMQS